MERYYLIIVNNKKSILLSSSNSKTDLRKKALDKIDDKIDRYDGLFLYRIKLMKVPKKLILSDSKSKIKVIGGPVVAIIEKILITVKPNNNNKVKLSSIGEQQRIYFSEFYLKNHNYMILDESISKLIWDWVNNKFNPGLFAINIINE